MYRSLLVAAGLLAAAPAAAQDTAPPAPITVTGSVALVSDYRFRGVSQSDEELAVQGGLTVTHKSGLYIGAWASNLAGWGTFGGSNTELDLIGGYKLPLGGGALDVGLTWYMYPGGASKTDFAEPYVKLSGTLGPASLLAGVAYAPKQQALGNWYATGAAAQSGGYTDPGDKEDNLYLWGDATAGIPTTPLTAKAHIGYSHGNPGLGPNGTSVTPTGSYWDWMIGADFAVKGTPLTLGVAYTDTDISRRGSAYLLPNFSNTEDGSSIAGPQVVFSVAAAF
ncbi:MULTISPECIES: TorF family putative porin [unclassified Sphingomonas]|uniref:TorF family putative porin n=1 Tax=unclassified Sphingomonas TaxID=196159 RepID=UPI00226AC7C8|nr:MULTISPECIES: TorF family putative porin [unclassified Sphingomonas]